MGRVTGRLPRFFFLYISIQFINHQVGRLGKTLCSSMSNINYELDKRKERLQINYLSMNQDRSISISGNLSDDGKTFFANSKAIDNCTDLSLTEKAGLKKYVSRESSSEDKTEIVFV